MATNRIDTSKVITWQYNNAFNLLRLLEAKEDVANCMIGDAWDTFYDKVFNINTCNEFGLYLWALVFGFERPTGITDDAFRRILKARFYNLYHGSDVPSYLKYLSLLLDVGPDSSHPERTLQFIDYYDMTFSIVLNWRPDDETIKVLEADGVIIHPTGVMKKTIIPGGNVFVGFGGWMCYRKDSSSAKIPLSISPTPIWGYADSEDTNLMIVPEAPYYAKLNGSSTYTALYLCEDYDKVQKQNGKTLYYTQSGGSEVFPDLSCVDVKKDASETSDTLTEIKGAYFYRKEDGSKVAIKNDTTTNRPETNADGTFKCAYYYEKSNVYSIKYDTTYESGTSGPQKGYYYETTESGETTKHYLKGQHLGVFNLSNFKAKSDESQ